MSEERDDETTKGGSEPGAGAPPGVTSAPGTVDGLRERITEATNQFLKARLGLEEEADGSLRLPDQSAFVDLGKRADQFLRGFFRGFLEKTPEEREAAAGLRDEKDVPNATEVAARLLSRVSDVVSEQFQEYLKDHPVDPKKPEAPVVVDGRFILRHGAPLLASFVQALGTRFSEPGTNAAVPPKPPEGKPHVDFKVDLPSVFKSLFVPPTSEEGDKR